MSPYFLRQPFDLRLLNVNGSAPLGNCDGCFLTSEANIAAFAKDYPERAAWWEDMEALATSLSKAKGMAPGRGAWFSKRYTRAELRRNDETQGAWAFDAVDYFCQADDGECMA